MDIGRVDYLEILEKIGLKQDEYIIWGSTPLVIRGIKETADDLDILVNKETWKKLTKRYKPTTRQVGIIKNDFIVIDKIDITYRVVGIWEENLEELFERADTIKGYQFLSLKDTIKWKSQTGREKDLKDVEKIIAFETQKVENNSSKLKNK